MQDTTFAYFSEGTTEVTPNNHRTVTFTAHTDPSTPIVYADIHLGGNCTDKLKSGVQLKGKSCNNLRNRMHPLAVTHESQIGVLGCLGCSKIRECILNQISIGFYGLLPVGISQLEGAVASE